MPCAEDLSLPGVQKDIAFWRGYENGLTDSYWIYFIPMGYIALIYSVMDRFNMKHLEFTPEIFFFVKSGIVITFIGSYVSVPLFFWFEDFRTLFFMVHYFSLHGLITTLLMSRQQKDRVLSINSKESLGPARSIKLGIGMICVQLISIWFSSQEKFYECPPSWTVVLDGWMFRGLICCHAIAYVMVKGLWITLCAETIEISDKDDKLIGKFLKRGEDWILEEARNE